MEKELSAYTFFWIVLEGSNLRTAQRRLNLNERQRFSPDQGSEFWTEGRFGTIYDAQAALSLVFNVQPTLQYAFEAR